MADALCVYGESIWRVILWMILLLFVFGPGMIALSGGLSWPLSAQQTYFSLSTPWQRASYVYFQYILHMLDTFTTASFAQLSPQNDLVRLCSGFLALAGIFMTGLLGFVAGNRIRQL